MPHNDDVLKLADACAAKMRDGGDTATLEPEFRALLEEVRRVAPQFAFDRDGRPAAIHAVREALPLMERDLLDAIVEDHACELAAVHEAMFEVARAVARQGLGGGQGRN